MEPQPPQPGGGGHMNIEGFVCEFYAAPGTFAIGTGAALARPLTLANSLSLSHTLIR
jgi:hypothetical protein